MRIDKTEEDRVLLIPENLNDVIALTGASQSMIRLRELADVHELKVGETLSLQFIRRTISYRKISSTDFEQL